MLHALPMPVQTKFYVQYFLNIKGNRWHWESSQEAKKVSLGQSWGQIGVRNSFFSLFNLSNFVWRRWQLSLSLSPLSFLSHSLFSNSLESLTWAPWACLRQRLVAFQVETLRKETKANLRQKKTIQMNQHIWSWNYFFCFFVGGDKVAKF